MNTAFVGDEIKKSQIRPVQRGGGKYSPLVLVHGGTGGEGQSLIYVRIPKKLDGFRSVWERGKSNPGGEEISIIERGDKRGVKGKSGKVRGMSHRFQMPRAPGNGWHEEGHESIEGQDRAENHNRVLEIAKRGSENRGEKSQ